MTFVIVLFILVITVVGFSLIGSRIAVGKSRLEVHSEDAHFPIVSGFNLERKEYEFPRDFLGKYNLVIVPFQQRQQLDVNTWIPAAQEIEHKYPGIVYYELPTIYELPTFSRTFINEGMRAGIPDPTSRERTVTLYLDKEVFKQALEITSEETIYLFLVDQEGNILWREEGIFSEEKRQNLLSVIENLPYSR
jgi:hypothetical protein